MNSHYVDLTLYRAYMEMRAEVTRGALGMLLWIIEPILYLGAFYLIFSSLNIRGGNDAIPYLLPALVIWKWFATSVYKGAISIESGAAVMQQIHVPKFIFVASSLLSSFFQFLIVFSLLLLFFIFSHQGPSTAWLYLPIIILSQAFVIMAIAGIFAAILPFIPDLKMVISNGLTLIFFLSGIFFDISAAPEQIQQILYLNPMASIVEAYRSVFLEHRAPDLSQLFTVSIYSIPVAVGAIALIHRWDRVYPRALSL